MVAKVVSKQGREDTVPPAHVASKGPVGERRGAVESIKKKEGIGLANLRDVDKAKVARLINHVMVAFKEIRRVKELLELERGTQAALVAKLQQQNHEVAAEVSQLRLKLASLQLVSPLPSQKVYLHTGRCSSLSPISEAENSEAESEVTWGLAPEAIEETKSILRERENNSSDFTLTAEEKDKCVFHKSKGTQQYVGKAQMGECHFSHSQPNVSESTGKENKDPELLLELTGDLHMANEEGAAVLRKRPPPRPLPDLLSNILHRCKDVGSASSADQSESSVNAVCKGNSYNAAMPILQGKVMPTVPQPPPPKPCASQKKLRFDPTAGEEGIFYYVSDVEKNVKGNLESGSLEPTVPVERQGVQFGGKPERVSSNMSSMEGQRLEKDTVESHWTPEAIERRNSFHRIPVVSPRPMNDCEGQPDEPTRLCSDSSDFKVMANEARRDISYTKEQEQLPASESEVFSITNEKSCFHKSRGSSQKTSKCINCSSVVPLRPTRAPMPSRHFAKYPGRSSKCSSIVNATPSIHQYHENEVSRGRVRRCDKYSRSKSGKKEMECVIKTFSRGEEDLSVSDPSNVSRSGNMARCGKCTTRPKSRLFKALGQQKHTKCQVGVRSCGSVDEEGSNPSSVLFCVASEDMYMSTQSSTDHSSKTKHVPTFPLKFCRIRPSKVKKKSGTGREMNSFKLLSGNSSEPTQEVFDVNRDVLDIFLQSDGKHVGQLKAPLAGSTECWIETWRLGKPHKSSHKELTEEELEQTSKAGSGSFAIQGRLDADLDIRRGLTLGNEGHRRARQHHHAHGRKQSSDTCKNLEVDDLLDRFIQSNAEYAAELIKCSVYFESTSSRPSCDDNIVGQEAAEGCTESNLPFQNLLTAKQALGSNNVSSEGGQPMREPFPVDRNESSFAQPCPEQSVRCAKCGGCIKTGTVLPPACAIGKIETKELRDLCDTCSASVTPEKVRRSADIWAEKNGQSASVPPIILPWVNSDDALEIQEAGQQKSSILPNASETLMCDAKKSGHWASETLHDAPDLLNEDHRMPIITGVSVSSWRSTPSMEMEEAGTVKDLTQMFDMSLLDLVNDLEGQRRDYWRRVNRHSMDEGTQIGKQCNNRRQNVDVDKVQRSSTSRRLLPSKKAHPNRFR